MKNLAAKMKAFRLSRELTQPEAAVVLGVSEATIYRLEAGAKGSDLTRARIANRMKDLK